MSVREIRGWTPATPLPHAPSYVRGVINLRGAVLPIIDLAARLGFLPTEPTARQVIIVVQVGTQMIGLLVDAVSDILTRRPTTIQPTPDVATETVQTFVRGDAGDRRPHDRPHRARRHHAGRGGGRSVRRSNVATDARVRRVGASGEFAFTNARFRATSRRCCTPTPASTCPIEGDAGLFAARQAAARAESRRAFATIATSSARSGARRAAGDAVGADHQRHAFLPRAASFRTPERRRSCRGCSRRRAAAAGSGCGRRPARPGRSPIRSR